MRISLALACLALNFIAVGCTRSVGGDAASISGTWQGTLRTPSGGLRLVVHIDEHKGKRTGVMESLDQDGAEIPLEIEPARQLAFRVPSLGGSFDSVWSDSLSAWKGTWSQSGYELPLVLTRAPDKVVVIEGLDGTWRAAVARDEKAFRLVLHVATNEHGTSATFDAPDAGATNLEVRELARDGGHVHFVVVLTKAVFDGQLAADGDSMTGMWSFPGRPVVQVTLAHVAREKAEATRARPQTPQPPFPYRAEEVRFENAQSAGVVLAGTLTIPEGEGPFPAALLVSGSGSEDRDETLFEHRPFAVLADQLTRHGIAVLRFDDRGAGASTGNFSQATARDLANDVAAGVAFLTRRAEVDPCAIGLIGHSEGGLHASMVASEDEAVKFAVLLAAPGIPMREVLLEQRRAIGGSLGVKEEELDRGDALFAAVLDTIASASTNDEAEARVKALLTPAARGALGLDEASAPLFVQQMTRSGIRHSLRIDPAAYLGNLHVPVLALGGSLDLQVDAKRNLSALRLALAADDGATIEELPGINHMLQRARTGAPTEYAKIEETVAPVVLALVEAWIAEKFQQVDSDTSADSRSRLSAS